MKVKNTFTSVVLIFLFSNFFVYGQTAKEELSQLMIDDSLDVGTIAMYPANVRGIIFVASTCPEGVVKLDDARKKSNESFKILISTYSREDQQKIWNLTRYNDLIAQLAISSKKKKVTEVINKFPDEIHDDAYEYGVNQHSLVDSIDKLNKEFDKSFQQIIAGYSAEEQSAFIELINTPEALGLLNQNLHLTFHLGSIYKSDSVLLFQQFDSLNLVLAEQKTKDAAEWKEEMQKNPDAQNELRLSAQDYSNESGSNESYYNTDPEVVEHYVYVPFPYWCGHPWWYQDDYWYPYPFWYHWGFYLWAGNVFWIGPPSPYFMHWQFQHNHHLYQYPHITNVYINHYHNGPRRSVTANSVEVSQWMKRNENEFPKDFKTNDQKRINYIREFGKSEIDRDVYNRENPVNSMTREDYMKKHVDEYPILKPKPEPKPEPTPVQQIIKPAEEKTQDKSTEKPVKEKSWKNIFNFPKMEKEESKHKDETPNTIPSVPSKPSAPSIPSTPTKSQSKTVTPPPPKRAQPPSDNPPVKEQQRKTK